MRHFFSWVLLVLVLLSAVAWAIKPRPVQDGKTLLVWCSDDNPARREQIGLFNRLHPQYHLRLDPGNNGMEKVIVQSEAGVGPDLFDSYNVFQSSAFIKAGVAWDITDHLTEAGIDVRADVWKAAEPFLIREGRVYGLIRNAVTDAVFYNQALFERAGIPQPKAAMNCQDFLELARKLTLKDADGRVTQFGFAFAWWQWPHFVNQWGGRMYSEDGTRCVLDSPNSVAAIQFLQDLIWKHNVSPTPEQEAGMAASGGWGSDSMKWFGAGRAAMACGGRWWLCLLRNKRDYPDLRRGVVEVQFGPVRSYMGYCGAVMINKHSPRREQALDFIRYMTGQEYNELINHQADGLGPIKKFTATEKFLHDPEFPEEDSNDVWRQVMAAGAPQEDCEFINGAVAQRIVSEQLDLVRANQKSAAEGMRSAARQINAEIEKTLARNPRLRERYEALRSRKEAAR